MTSPNTPASNASTLDPITLEVLRHRLMMINDEQARVASQLSGSPVVYEAKDFNSAMLTPEGDSLFIGIFMTRLSLCLNAAVKTVLDRFADTVGLNDGDAFVTNDPWAGAAHMNDILMFAPIFHGDTLVCWTGLAMHEVDVGGPNPGSFTVGTPNVYGEAPLIPPIKMIEGGKVREDLEALVIRNSRTSELNGLDLRARIAAINRTRQRIREVIKEYGLDHVMEAQRRILELVQASFARRLRSLPDGRWVSQGFIDHDGNQNRLYRIRLAMTKSGERLTFDFTGTDKQAAGAINCTRVGLESGVFSAVLPMLCYDISWSPGGMMPLIDIISEEGTINNARHPAAVSMATVSAIFATSHVTSGAIAKMLAASGLREEIQANWAPAWQGMTLAGQRTDGRPFTAVLLDVTGGSGARAVKDGIDGGGLPGSPAMAVGNVETYEKEHPILYVFRRQAPDTGGAGLYRGGMGLESMLMAHGANGPVDVTVLTHGASQPEAQGLCGGYPSSVQVRMLLRDAGLADAFAERRIPNSAEELPNARVEMLAAKQRTLLHPEDALVMVCAGGGGYGDPLRRDPQAVAADLKSGLIGPDTVRETYGVVLSADTVDSAATEAQRACIRRARLNGAPERAEPNGSGLSAGRQPKIGDTLDLVGTGTEAHLACHECGHSFGSPAADPKAHAQSRTLTIDRLSPWNIHGLVSEIEVREYFCPSCALLIDVEVARKDDPPLMGSVLAAGA